MTVLKKYGSSLSTFALFAVFIYALVRPSVISGETKNAITFCMAVIIPSLFLNMALASYLFPRIINMSGGKHVDIAALVGGIVCGFPVGATLASSVYKNGASREYAEYINSFANNASLSFVISFAGMGALKSKTAGVALALLELLSAIICMYVMRFVIKPDRTCVLPRQTEITFTEALKNTVKSMATVCGSIVAFSCVASIATLAVPHDSVAYAIIKGILEFSGGINEAAKLEKECALVLAAAFIGFSGVCVFLQIRSIAAKEIKIRYYILSKLLQSGIMGAGAVIISKILY